jgi:hypothetical protein
LTSDPAAEEFRSDPESRALETIARKSGGEMLSAALFLARFGQRSPQQEGAHHRELTSPLWHQASVFLSRLPVL